MEPLFGKNSNFRDMASYELAFLTVKNKIEFFSYSATYRHLKWIFSHFFRDFYRYTPRTFFLNAAKKFFFSQIQGKSIINRCFEKKIEFRYILKKLEYFEDWQNFEKSCFLSIYSSNKYSRRLLLLLSYKHNNN